jgi:hypothetical protein
MRIACILTIVLVPAGILIRTYKHTKQHN